MPSEIAQGAKQRYRNVVIKLITAAVTLTENDEICHITTNGTYTVTLPPVRSMIGRLITLMQHATGTNSVTIAHAGDSVNWTNQIINADGERVVLYSDGLSWIVLVGQAS